MIEAQFAFPGALSNGMTLRDYFAAHAIYTALVVWNERAQTSLSFEGQNKSVADIAYEIADTMLEAREKS